MTARRTLDRHMTEAQLQEAIIDLARLRGWLIHHDRPARLANGEWRTPIQGDHGFPDLVLVRGGRVLFREIKAAKGFLSQEQERWRWALDDDDYAVWRPEDWSSGLIGQTLT